MQEVEVLDKEEEGLSPEESTSELSEYEEYTGWWKDKFVTFYMIAMKVFIFVHVCVCVQWNSGAVPICLFSWNKFRFKWRELYVQYSVNENSSYFVPDSEEETGPRLKPVFVRKKDRVTVIEKEREVLRQKQVEIEAKKMAEERRKYTLKVPK